jgi:hypothetical protein
VEDRISGLKDKIDIKEKNRRILRQKNEELQIQYAKNCDSIKRPYLRIMSIKEGEEVQAKGMRNIFNKIIAENFQKLNKEIPIQNTNT